MKMKCLILAIVFIFFQKQVNFASAINWNTFIYKQDTFELFTNPFQQLPNIDSLEAIFHKNKQYKNFTNLDCWKHYAGEWEIIDNQLYLINIFSCYYNDEDLKTDLQHFFGNKYLNGKIKADWFTGSLQVAQEKLLPHINAAGKHFYAREMDFIFKKGKLKNIKTYDNSKSKISTYSQPENLAKFIYSNINWDALPTFDEPIIVVIGFSANEAGIIDSTVIKKGRDTAFNNEAIRVIKSIPQWDILYKMGVHKRLTICYPIRFNAENRAKYKQ